jgi:hypothetical protein
LNISKEILESFKLINNQVKIQYLNFIRLIFP